MININIKPNFSLCVDLATKLLAKQTLTSTKINIMDLNYDKNIIFDTIQNYCKLTGASIDNYIDNDKLLSEGCCITVPEHDLYIILYNDKDQSKEHLNWTLAHEIGHIYCGHKKDSRIEEIEAHFFAAQLLMPEYTIYKMSQLGTVSTEDIYLLFNVSITAANKRIITLNKRYSINCGEFDKKVWDMMKSTVEQYYKLDDYNIKIGT